VTTFYENIKADSLYQQAGFIPATGRGPYFYIGQMDSTHKERMRRQ